MDEHPPPLWRMMLDWVVLGFALVLLIPYALICAVRMWWSEKREAPAEKTDDHQ